MDILLDHVTAATAPKGMTHRIARLAASHGTTATTAPTPCPCGMGVTTLVAGVELTPLCPHNPAALEPTSPVMIQAVEDGDGWKLWLRDGVPVVWIRDLGAGWVELCWPR
ncbi:MAG: hypothetical protein H6716_29180 [Polyangiaceae bacterium]|nr:hypothetical protein [Polyangiaceae bacterium]